MNRFLVLQNILLAEIDKHDKLIFERAFQIFLN